MSDDDLMICDYDFFPEQEEDLLFMFEENLPEDKELIKSHSSSSYSMCEDYSNEAKEIPVKEEFNSGYGGTNPLVEPKRFSLTYLRSHATFFEKITANTELNEQQELHDFHRLLQSKQAEFGARVMRKVTKRIFGKDYLKGLGLTTSQIRHRVNMLEMKFYAIACRHLAIQSGFSMTKEAFLERFQPVIDSFCNPTNGSSSPNNCHRVYYEQLMNDDSELQFLFRFLSPLLILENTECSGEFFRRKNGLLLALGEFMEFSGRQYTSGGGKTLKTRLREACMDTITGNKRPKRNRKSRHDPRPYKNQRLASTYGNELSQQSRNLLIESETDSQSSDEMEQDLSE